MKVDLSSVFKPMLHREAVRQCEALNLYHGQAFAIAAKAHAACQGHGIVACKLPTIVVVRVCPCVTVIPQ